jgi:hypothetical protein
LHTSGCKPLQRVCPAPQAAVLQPPVVELQSAAVAHAMPWFVQPFWFVLQTCGCAPLQ